MLNLIKLIPFLGQLFNLANGNKTYLAAFGLMGLAVYQLSTGDYTAALQSFMAGLAAMGLRNGLEKAVQDLGPPAHR